MDYSKGESKAWGRENLTGQWTTMVTPFTSEDEIDEKGLEHNVEHVLRLGVAGMGFSWNMGEFWSLTDEERLRLMELAPSLVKKRARIAFQVTHTSAKEAVSLANRAESLGYDFIILAAPYIMAKKEEQVIEFIERIASRTDIGIAFYNSPQFGITMSAKGMSRLADIENMIAIKEASGNMQLSIDTHLAVGDKAVVSMPDEEIFFFEPFYNFHQQVMFANTSDWLFDSRDRHDYVNFIDLATNGELDKARELYRKIEPIKKVSRKWWSQTVARTGGALPVQMAKYWGELMGMSGGGVRLPLQDLAGEEKAEMRSDLARLGLIEAKTEEAAEAGSPR
jgi:4-hydroxy-tetrahydrodipicolinate synthase